MKVLLVLLAVVVVGAWLFLGQRVEMPAGAPRGEEVAAPVPPVAGVQAEASGDAATGGEELARTGEPQPGVLYGRVTTHLGTQHEGRLRFGGGQEAFWGDYFNGAKVGNPWVSAVPPERLPRERRALSLFGFELALRDRPADLDRLFMVRLGDLVRIEAVGTEVRVTLKSGRVVALARMEASDFDDGLRVWGPAGQVVNLDSSEIASIDLLPAVWSGEPLGRLSGTVRTAGGTFTGFVQWDREECLGSDRLVGEPVVEASPTDRGGAEPSRRGGRGQSPPRAEIPFAEIQALAREGEDHTRVTRRDGATLLLGGHPKVGPGNRGLYVEDRRFGRVLVSWEAFERVDFAPSDSGPAYADFAPGAPLTGTVTTTDGRQLAGRLVFDLDESETVETLDAPLGGVDYTIPFALVATIERDSGGGEGPATGEVQGAVRVTLHTGEVLALEAAGDLGERNAGVLVLGPTEGAPAEYVPWWELRRLELRR
jgi:hypothetical protein